MTNEELMFIVLALQTQVAELRFRVAVLEKDSHPPVNLAPAIEQILKTTRKRK